MKGKTTGSRIIHYDLLRILAAFSVVMLHSAAQFWYTLDIYGYGWLIANSYDAVFRFGVPIFVMISGALFLNPAYELDLKRLFKHNIFRFLLMYLIWSCLYGLWDCRTYDFTTAGWKPFVREMLYGRYHLWFIPMLIGLYLLLPILKSWLNHAEKKNVEYFLGLFFVLQICSETIRALTVMDELHYILDLTKIEMACSYLGYFVLGYYLSYMGISRKMCRVFYIGFIPAVLCNVVLGNYLARSTGEAVGKIYDSYGLFTFWMVTALFLFFHEHVSKKNFGEIGIKVIREISSDTLGIYILHIGLMEILETKGFHSMSLPIIAGIPIHALLCFVICMVIAGILRRIPLIGKYLC